ncbi:MAG: nuclear transport factor 2 family protein [Gammaproteobacteria bacterium]|uniref:nuclear transport factor 2 family protein n=1 Tax=Pseudomaricurvus alcaniphilus TaxID=1166482 RepID=UPI001409C0E1|nr:nuclear transport factor 2 family protein [Pseudomaricurvus alcaniphilus]MBR9910633.1 nuclear transport factor 2 family protein [Gammaproteobacteria bacterium]NHN36843.1 nuclear transport factor 2 family protein [Pseudomaricurvus alcaniphilus]
MEYPREEVEAASIRLREAFVEAERRNTWSWIADELYHEDATYYCPYGGAMPVFARNRDEIRATHYGRDMDVGSGWSGWSFPITDIYVSGNNIVTRWVNRGPGKRADGSYYETEGVSFITYGGDGKFSSQYDLFDIGHQMKLCDELKAAGLLDPTLEEQWVKPLKRRIINSLNEGISPGDTDLFKR